ncbi:MFS transporter [Nocardia puris]|uniref:MFS transporter n=1 Tax=Nocardia puris TaxID=208602 RepID=UPI00189302DA|nr:MFS transporter [Nocardia puris]MBF6364986.1 MFS transporter [Nocardia puris]MBF6458772.1 MFS transporter [Nocardia puris]
MPVDTDITPTRLPRDFHKLWAALTVSQVGSALGTGALPLVAILVVHASDWQVSLMAALSGVAAAAIALPLGSLIEVRRKRPVMIQACVASCVALASVPVAAALGVLSYAQLCGVAMVQTLCAMVFNAANGAYLKSIVAEPLRVRANSRVETTFWTAATVGAPLGGLLISLFGTAITITLDAVTYLLAALGIRAITTPETASQQPKRPRLTDIRGGWAYIFGEPTLNRLFWNAMLFGGSLLLTGPLLALLMLRELGFAPWQYGLALGLPAVGGLIGSLCAPKLVAVFDQRTVLLGFGTLRTLWLGLLLLAGPDALGLIAIIAAETLLLLCAGVFNPVFTTVRMNHTADTHMARVGMAWSISAKCFQPAFIALGGVIAAVTSVRTAIACAAVALVASSALLPWRQRDCGREQSSPSNRRHPIAERSE